MHDEEAPLSRLRALAERAPATFTAAVVAHSVEMVEHGWVSPELLDPLRILAANRPEFAPEIVRVALAVMREAASVPAGRCVADLAEHADAADVDERACRSAVVLAGAPSRHPLTRRREATDPVSLLAVAGLDPDSRIAAYIRSRAKSRSKHKRGHYEFSKKQIVQVIVAGTALSGGAVIVHIGDVSGCGALPLMWLMSKNFDYRILPSSTRPLR